MFLGLVVDLGGTVVFGFLAAMIFAIFLGATGRGDEVESLFGDIRYDSGPGLVLTAIGCFFSALGGHVCARIAKHSEYRLGGIMAAISVVLGVLLDPQPGAASVLLVVATVASVMAGVHLGVRANRRDAVKARA